MIWLYDLDSTIYGATYKIDDGLTDQWKFDNRSEKWILEEKVNLSINRLMQMTGNVFKEIEDTGISMTDIYYYITYCKYPVRKWIYPDYKANRESDELVSAVRRKLISMNFARCSEYWEADDMIADDAAKIGDPNFLIISRDKDFDQIKGVRFNDYRPKPPKGDELDPNGFRRRMPCVGLKVVTEKEANYNLWTQVLTGDETDNIKGIKGIGLGKAQKILEGRTNLMRATYEAYITKFGGLGKFEFFKNYFLIKLGTKRKQ